MEKNIKKILVYFVCLVSVLSFSGCKKNIEPEQSEQQSQNVEYQYEEQGIAVMSSVRIGQGEEASLAHSEDVAGIMIINNNEKTLQYAEITQEFSDGTVHTYKVSTVPPGEACRVISEGYMPYRSVTEEGFFGYKISKVAFFAQEPSVMSDKFKVSGVDGILNVENISGADISDNVVIYYKDYEEAQLASGATYRVTINGGIKSGEIKQIAASHYKSKGSMLMMIQLVSEVS